MTVSVDPRLAPGVGDSVNGRDETLTVSPTFRCACSASASSIAIVLDPGGD
jgi:hypothetical protein